MGKDLILNGIHIGEHSFRPDAVKQELYDRCIQPGYNFVTIRTHREAVPQHYFLEWAEYLAQNRVYFTFLYTIQCAPDDRVSHLEKETVAKMKEIAGEYFLGDMIAETGSSGACMMPGYFARPEGAIRKDVEVSDTEAQDMADAHARYLAKVSKYTEIDRELGVPNILSVEATALSKYNAEAGVTVPILEMMCGDPDVLISSLRGTARATDAKRWGTYSAQEWYGGMRHDDILKRKRLELGYKYAYLAGSQIFCLESGDERVESYGHRFEEDSPICQDYRRMLGETMKLIRRDSRPKGGPKVKVAFVSGLHDAWGGWGGSSAWGQFHRESWGHGEAEHSWRLAYEIGTKRTWADIGNYGETDQSAWPAYGMYDIVPVEALLEKLCRYDRLIFLGYNTMTEENLSKLTAYVRQGGNLLMTAAHLNTSAKREGEFLLPDSNALEVLFGARATGQVRRSNGGVKFRYDALDRELRYPGTKSLVCDPVYSAGYVRYERFEVTTGRETAFVSESFLNDPSDLPAVIENRVGDGIATLVTSTNYPGHPGLYPLYRAMVREWITASARFCEVQVLSSDRLRYSVYENGKMYLLNTDYDLPIWVKVTRDGKEQTLSLEPLELKILEG